MAYQVDLFDPPPPAPKPKLDVGESCPVPGYFPSGGGDPQKAWRQLDLIEKKDWKGLQEIQARWWCHFCENWHDFDKFFFDAFDGVYPHEIGEAPDHEWHHRLGGWEAMFRRDFGYVGRTTADILRDFTHAAYYAYWAERNKFGFIIQESEG